MQEGILLSAESGGGGGCVLTAPGQQMKNYLFMESGLGVSRFPGKQRVQEWSEETQQMNLPNPDNLW